MTASDKPSKATCEEALPDTPRVFWVSEAGWVAVQTLLDEDESVRVSEATLAWISNTVTLGRRPTNS